MKAAATRSLESLCNSYNNDLATISKSYPAGRHISYDFDANCECGAPHNPTRHLTWQSVRINCRGLAKRAAGDGFPPASTLQHPPKARGPPAVARDDPAWNQSPPISQ